MRVYLHGSPDQPPPARHTLLVTPAAHLPGQEMPHEFVERDGSPRTFDILFEYGKAEVPDVLGKYLVENKLAEKTRLILPGVFT